MLDLAEMCYRGSMQIETKYNLGDKTWILIKTDKQIIKRYSECDRVLVNRRKYGARQVTVTTISYMKMSRCDQKESDRINYHFKEEEPDVYGGMNSCIRDESQTFTTKNKALAAAEAQNEKELAKSIPPVTKPDKPQLDEADETSAIDMLEEFNRLEKIDSPVGGREFHFREYRD